MQRYVVLKKEDVYELEGAVNEWLDMYEEEKYRPVGGPFVTHSGLYCQALNKSVEQIKE